MALSICIYVYVSESVYIHVFVTMRICIQIIMAVSVYIHVYVAVSVCIYVCVLSMHMWLHAESFKEVVRPF